MIFSTFVLLYPLRVGRLVHGINSLLLILEVGVDHIIRLLEMTWEIRLLARLVLVLGLEFCVGLILTGRWLLVDILAFLVSLCLVPSISQLVVTLHVWWTFPICSLSLS